MLNEEKSSCCYSFFSEEEPKVIATARGVFDHRGGLLESTETNVSIYIPAGALPEGKKQEVYFKVCQDSKYMPPLDSNSGKCSTHPESFYGPTNPQDFNEATFHAGDTHELVVLFSLIVL